MTMIQNVLFLTLLMSMTACSQFLTHRDYLSEMEQDDSKFYSPNRDFPVMAGDTGRTEESRSERRRRTPASAEQLQKERGTYSLNNELKQLENKLSESSFELYDQHKDKLVTTSEKIYFLKLPSRERKDYLISRGFLTEQKTTNYREKMYANRQSSIILGMSKSDVMNNFGKPNRVEVAGNPSFENERWVYKVNGASKYIYFESGQVGGWE